MYLDLQTGKTDVFEKGKQFYTGMSRDVALQRKRVGGNWVIAQAVPNRALR